MRTLGVAVLVLLLAGCTAPPVVEHVETPALPVIEPAEIPAQPAQVFDGKCSNIVEPKALREAVSGAWVAGSSADSTLAPRDHVIANVGGLPCVWFTDDGQGIGITALPADAASAPEDTSCGFQTDLSAFTCAIDVTANGTRIAGVYSASSGDVASLGATVADIEAVFAASAMNAVSITAPAQPSAWPSGPDCAALDITGFTSQDSSGGTDVFFSPAVLSLTGGTTLPQCSIVDTDVRFSVLGGGRWMESAVRAAPGSAEVAVDGLELVILVPTDDLYSINVFDGVNWLQVPFSDGDEKIYPVLIAVVDALNTL